VSLIEDEITVPNPHYPVGKFAKINTLKVYVFANWALKTQCHIVKNRGLPERFLGVGAAPNLTLTIYSPLLAHII